MGISLGAWIALIAMRLPFLWLGWMHPDRCVMTDSTGYLQLARNLAFHGVFSESSSAPWSPATFRAPGYPLFLSLFVRLFQDPVPWIVSTQLAISLWTVWILFQWLRSLDTPGRAAVVSIAYGMDLVSLYHHPLVLTETLFNFSLVIALRGLWALKSLPRDFRNAWTCGVLWSVPLMIRPIALYLPFILAILWCRTRRTFVGFLAGVVILPALWSVRNWVELGHPVYNTQGGYELLRCPGAAVEALRTRQPWSIVWPRLRSELDRQVAPRDEFAIQRSQVASQMALRILRDHPGLLMIHSLQGVVKILGATVFIMPIQMFNPAFTQDTSLQTAPRITQNLELLKRYPILAPLQVSYSIYLLLFYCIWARGIWVCWSHDRRREALVLFVGAAYFVALASVEGQGRYRIPIMPFLAGAAVVGLPWRRDSARR